MEAKIEDLKKGDEIIFAKGSLLIYACLLETPRVSKTRTSWRTKQSAYINVKCSMKEDRRAYHTTWKGQPNTYYYEGYALVPDEHDVIKKVNLNDRKIWLVKRKRNELLID